MEPRTGVSFKGHNPSPNLSVVVCTRDRLSKLKRCIDALLAATVARDWEIVVVDSCSNDGTGEYLASIDQKRFNRVDVTTTFETKRGSAAARNRGWYSTKADIIVFIDDDCYAAEDYLDSIQQVFDEHPEAGFIGGRVLLFDPADYRMTIQDSQESFCFQPKTFVAPGIVHGANMAFRRT